MKYKGVILDLDGVICSTDEYHYLAWKSLADTLGIAFDRGINNRLRGVSRMASLEIVLERSGQKYTDAQKAELAEIKNALYRELLGQMTPADLADEVIQTLEVLRAKGLKLAIGSSSRNTPYILERIGLGDFFDAVSDGNNITRSKPDPEVFEKAAQMLGLDPSDCLVVEDAHAGVEAAANGGFDAAAIGDARGDARARWHLNRFGDLIGIIN